MHILPSVDIIILNYNGLKYTPKCIATLYKNTVYPFHLIVVDNVSTDGSREWLQTNAPNLKNITVHYNKRLDGGYSAGNNIGLKYSTGDYVLLLNNDILVAQPGWLRSMVEEMEENPQLGLQGVKLVYLNDLIQHAGVTFGYEPQEQLIVPFHIGRYANREKYSEKKLVPAVTFACVLIRKILLQNGLDESYPTGCFEDIDFCCTARKLGYDILYNGEIELYHYEGATNLRRPQQQFRVRVEKNFHIFQKRWGQWLLEDREKHREFYQQNLPDGMVVREGG